ncbi:MAG TPA: hypothetical protein DDW52_01405 [Planctomycetaceae bacterium]|nr:hypothetical protein [Planctomycetaceae bacterium]
MSRLATDSPSPWTPTKGVKIVISVLLCLHLLAVLVEPLQFFSQSPRGVSEAVSPVRRVMAPYSEFAYFNHGYFFFAPEPGPSHLVRADLIYDDGGSATLQFPDKDAQWPRLLYHRHFMLSEFLHILHAPPVDPAVSAEDPELFQNWRRDRNRFLRVRDSFAAHLKDKHQCSQVAITRIEHALPRHVDVLQRGMQLDDPALYIELPDGPPPVLDEQLPYAAGTLSPQDAGYNSRPMNSPLAVPGGTGEEIQP